ncbi:MAG: hypothetical protein N3I35_12170 [Clostridia bacterium]|nr:hypothetical protein [Clostridia bacterium]
MILLTNWQKYSKACRKHELYYKIEVEYMTEQVSGNKNRIIKSSLIVSITTGIFLFYLTGYVYFLWMVSIVVLSWSLRLLAERIGTDRKEIDFLSLISIIGLVLRILSVIINSVYPVLYLSDAQTYEQEGMKIVEEWRNGNLFFTSPSEHFFYYTYNAIIYFLFGFHPSIVNIVNSFLGVAAALNIYVICNRMFGYKAAKVSLILCLFFPSLVVWQILNLKEAMVVFLLTAIIRNLYYVQKQIRARTIVSLAIYVVVLTITRSYAGIFMACVVCVYFLIALRVTVMKKVAVSFAMVAAMGIVTYKAGMGFFGWEFLKYYNLDTLDLFRNTRYRGGSEVLLDMHINTLSGLLKFLPVAFLYFMFSPFPWQFGGTMLQMAGALENILWYILFFIFTLPGIYYTLKLKKDRLFSSVLILILMAFTGLYCLQMGNMGFAYRMRGQLLPIYFIFASYGFVQSYNIRKSLKNR